MANYEKTVKPFENVSTSHHHLPSPTSSSSLYTKNPREIKQKGKRGRKKVFNGEFFAFSFNFSFSLSIRFFFILAEYAEKQSAVKSISYTTENVCDYRVWYARMKRNETKKEKKK